MINETSTKAEVLAAVKQDGYALRFASDELRGDKEVVLAAVKQDGRAFEYASEELRCEMAECWVAPHFFCCCD